MQRFIITLAAALTFLFAAGFSTGIFTPEVRHEESCALCRAVRYTGKHYGFPYEHIESNAMTDWYRRNVDPIHGLDQVHAHVWQQSACAEPGKGDAMRYDCGEIPPVFMMRPEVERSVLVRIPDRATQVGVIRAINDPDRALSLRRAQLLVQYYYVDRDRTTWDAWWQEHARDFGLVPLALPALDAAPNVPSGDGRR